MATNPSDQIAPNFSTNNGDAKVGDTLYDLKQMKGTRTSFSENGDYKVDNLMYPENLLSSNTNDKYKRTGNSEYGNNYVVFYINVNASSKLLTDKFDGVKNETVKDWTPNDKTRIVGQNVTAKEAALGSGVEGAMTGGVLSGDFKGAAVAGGVSALGVGAVASQVGSFTRQMKRLRAAIALNTPNQFTARYSANWSEADTNLFQMAMRGSENLGKAVMEYSNGNTSEATDAAKQDLTIGAAIALNTIPGKDAVSALTGLATNPKKEQIFKGVDFRTFQFDYQFYPKSKAEYQNVQNIIYMFKLHMHPEYKDTNNFLYIYPSEFDIVHYNGVDENFNLPRHTSCALVDLTVNYTPQSQFTSFNGGAPTQINISMTFKELAQMSKERIQEGF